MSCIEFRFKYPLYILLCKKSYVPIEFFHVSFLLNPVDGSRFHSTRSSRWGCDGPPPPGLSSPLSIAGPMHIGTAKAPLCKVVKGRAVIANDLPLRNDLKEWPDSSVGRALDVHSQASRVRIPVRSVIFSHFHFSELYHLKCDRYILQELMQSKADTL